MTDVSVVEDEVVEVDVPEEAPAGDAGICQPSHPHGRVGQQLRHGIQHSR